MILNGDAGADIDTTRKEAHRQYPVDLPGKIVFIGHHLSMTESIGCLIRSISLSGAHIEIGAGVSLPTNFYLEVMGIRDEIGCTLMRQEGENATLGFNMLIDPEFLHHLRRLSFEAS